MAHTDPPLVAVVTPVYNGARHIAQCIESVLAQTWANWQYDILDNRSDDGTLAVLERYAARDSRIRVHANATFVPALRNHNLALRLASPDSRYIKVVFADDWLYPECLQRMVELAERNPAVGLVGSYGLRGNKVAWDGLPYDQEVVPGRDLSRNRLRGGAYVFGSATSLLMRADLVRSREYFYNESNVHCDTEVCFDLLRHCDFGFVHQVLTFTREEEGSLTSRSRRLNTYLSGFLYDLRKFGPELLQPAELAAATDSQLRRYYDFLARGALRRQDAEFWPYHLRQLREAGYPLSRVRLAGAVLGRVLDAVLNPKRTVENLLRSGAAAKRPKDE